jgi:hypothetical protein
MSDILKRVSSPSTTTPASVDEIVITTNSPAEIIMMDETQGLFRNTLEYASEIKALTHYVMEKGDLIQSHKVS